MADDEEIEGQRSRLEFEILERFYETKDYQKLTA
jgi:hypothetical protein